VEVLRDFLQAGNRGRADRLREHYDDFGLDTEYLDTWDPWFEFLRKVYWRLEVEGLEKLPVSGAGLLVPNHRGFMPFDGVMHRCTILKGRGRHVRFLTIPSLFKFPFLSDFLIKQGAVVASQQSTRRLTEKGELVGFFPEGIGGAFRMYKGAYQLGAFGRNAFAKLAIENQIPVIPAATIGHVEIFPILDKVRSSAVTRWTGWPFLPITPTFPFLPVPLPTKWHIRYLDPITVDHLRPEDSLNPRKVREFSREVKALLQKNIDEMLTRRKHLFFGNIFKGGSTGRAGPPMESA
jgi:1-acyl-sn-glycerol-3-phosphate acyltransferase